MKNLILAVMLCASAGYQSKAQELVLPNPSTTQTIIQDLGLGKVSITYSRPYVKGRKIFGGLVPFGQLWRAGANNATVVRFSEDVMIEGHAIPAGTYSLFCIPQRDQWMIILNKDAQQWGAYAYDQTKDLLRFNIKTVNTDQMQESFTAQFNDPTTTSANLTISWEYTAVSIQIKSDDDARIMANIDSLMLSPQVSNLTYFNAIQYYLINNKDHAKTLALIARAEKDFPARASFKLFKSRLLLKSGDMAGAKAAAEAGIKTAREINDTEYLRLNQEALLLTNG